MKRSVYLLKLNEFYKIGIAWDVNRRFVQLYSSSPYTIELVASKPFDNASKVEKDLHKKYHKYAVKNEWFKLPKKEVSYVKDLLK